MKLLGLSISSENYSHLRLPIVKASISAGFPSPAEDYIDKKIDLNQELIHHPSSTFFLRVSGQSMTGAGIHDGDLLIVDRSLTPIPNQIVIAILDGSFTVKRLIQKSNTLFLEAAHPSYRSP